MEHVGLYVGLAVYTLAGAKVHVQKFLHPQLGSPSHINHHIHHHSLLQIFQVIENPAEQEKLEVFQVNFQSLKFAYCCAVFFCYRYIEVAIHLSN